MSSARLTTRTDCPVKTEEPAPYRTALVGTEIPNITDDEQAFALPTLKDG